MAVFDVDDAYREHGAAIFRFAVGAVGDRTEAEDLVQEVFTRAWRSRGQYDADRASLRTWLFAIARNLALDVHRARGRRPLLLDGGSDGPAGAALDDAREPSHGPEEDVVERLRVAEALARLSPEHREVITAVHLQGRTYRELALATGVGVATLRTRMHYGLRVMRAVLDEAEGSGRE